MTYKPHIFVFLFVLASWSDDPEDAADMTEIMCQTRSATGCALGMERN